VTATARSHPPLPPAGMGRVAAVVVAAGRGLRFAGGENKAFAPILGRPLLAHTLERVEAAGVGRYVVVVAPGEEARCMAEVVRPFGFRPARVVAGGPRRSDSVRAGLRTLEREGACDAVLVHDGARPLASPDLWRRVAHAALEAGAAVPVLPVTDAVKRVEGERVRATLSRESLFLAQTPQGFLPDLLRRAHRLEGETAGEPPDAGDDAALVEALGWEVVAVPGEPWNLKVTYPTDRLLAEAWLRSLRRAVSAGGSGEAAPGEPGGFPGGAFPRRGEGGC
jgi:2-C-methyl-D-erythritol 4-phosphate cytidylyltransferase